MFYQPLTFEHLFAHLAVFDSMVLAFTYYHSVGCILQSGSKAIQHVRQSIYNLYDCAGPRLFHLAYGISFYAFWRRFHVLFPHISMTLKWWKRHKYGDNYEVEEGQIIGNFCLLPIAN